MIYLCGDVHHKTDIDKLSEENWPEGQQLTKDDYLIILGDVAIIWFIKKCDREKELIDWYNQQPWTTLFIDGNHENFDRLLSSEFPKIDMFESVVKKISQSIFYLQRGYVYTIDRKKIFTFGGGESIDKNSRLTNINWWEKELPTFKETSKAIDCFKKHNNKVDFILTHVCSEKMFDKLMLKADFNYKRDDERSLRSFFSWIEFNVNFKKWYFGHYHDDFDFNKFSLLYNRKPIRIS
jgi:hypothetical protein